MTRTGVRHTVLLANPGADLYGSDRMAVETVRALVAAGLGVVVTVPGPGPLIQLFTEAGARVFEQPTPIIRRGLLSFRGLLQLARESATTLMPSIRLVKHVGADLVVVNTITPPLWYLVGRLAGKRVVGHVHEAESTTPRLLRLALYLPLHLCHQVIVNSRFTRDVLAASAPALAGRTSVVYNAVAGPEHIVPARAEITGPLRVLFTGRLSHRKGPHVVVEALRLLKARGVDAHLSLLGAVFPGNEGYEDSLRSQVAEAGLAASVDFLGFAAPIWPHLARADVAVVPSLLDESFGNTAVEASLAARPLIVSDIAGLKEASQLTSSRIPVPPGDAVAIADAVEEIATNWNAFRDRAATDARVVGDAFSPDRFARSLLSALGLERVS